MRCIVCGTEMTNSIGGNYHCLNCGHAVSDLVNRFSNCDMPAPQGFGEQKGWICPVCGRGVAPWVDYCPCQEGKNYTTIFCGDTYSVSNTDEEPSNITTLDNSEWSKYITYTGGLTRACWRDEY